MVNSIFSRVEHLHTVIVMQEHILIRIFQTDVLGLTKPTAHFSYQMSVASSWEVHWGKVYAVNSGRPEGRSRARTPNGLFVEEKESITHQQQYVVQNLNSFEYMAMKGKNIFSESYLARLEQFKLCIHFCDTPYMYKEWADWGLAEK